MHDVITASWFGVFFFTTFFFIIIIISSGYIESFLELFYPGGGTDNNGKVSLLDELVDSVLTEKGKSQVFQSCQTFLLISE